MTLADWTTRLLWENALFLVTSTVVLAIVGVAWRDLKPFTVPRPFPSWFKAWFLPVQVVGVLLPVLAWGGWGLWRGNAWVSLVWLPILAMLGLQVFAEWLTSRQFASVTWVMAPYLYLPYRMWQLYEGLQILPKTDELVWVRSLLWANLVVWILNYVLDVTQLPRLFRWGGAGETVDEALSAQQIR